MLHFASHSLFIALFVGGAEPPRPRADPTPPGIPFHRYTVKDALGRTIAFYLSVPPKDDPDTRRPVALFIPGSGCQSLFQKRDGRITGGYHNLLWQEAKG